MKKIYALLIPAALLLAASCSKETAKIENDGSSVFTASFADETRTSLGTGGKVDWVSGDKVKIVWNGGSVDAAATSAGAATTFVAEVGEADKYYAVYPNFSTTLGGAEDDFDIQFTIPKTQHGTFAEANVAVAVTDAAAKEFSFRNVCAIVKFTLTRSDIKEVRFRPSPDTKIVGLKSIAISSDGTPSVIGAEGNVETVVTPASGSVFDPGDYYIGVAPITCQDGFTFKCKKSDDSSIPYKTSSKTVQLVRSHMMNFGVIDDTEIIVGSDFYVTPSGAGDKSGHSWNNAYDVDELRTLLKTGENLNGNKVFLAGGTYVIGTEEENYLDLAYESGMAVIFEGGYNASTGIREPSSQSTVFSGDGTYPIFQMRDNVNFTFDGCSFCRSNALSGTPDVRAITMNATTAIVRLNNCKLQDNVENVAKGGPALFIKSGKLYANACQFTGNVAKSQGGAIRVEGDNAQFFANDCVFYDNKIGASATYGSVMFVKGNVGLNRCVFYGNHEPEGINQPVLNTNYNYILTGNTIIGASNYSTGTGLIRSETTGNYSGLLFGNIMVNTYSGSNKAWCVLNGKADKKVVSGGFNFFCSQDGSVSSTANLPVNDTDVEASSLGSAAFSFDAGTLTLSWTAPLTGYTPATKSQTLAAIQNYIAPTAGIKTIGQDYISWLTSIGEL